MSADDVSLGTVQRLAVDDLNPMQGNPRRGQIEVIADSLKANGQYRPLVVNKGTVTGRLNEVLAGNHTLIAARSIGLTQLDVYLIDVDDAAAKRIVAVDNRSSDLGTYDSEALIELLQSLDDLDGTGYSDNDLTALVTSVADPTSPDEFPSFDEDLKTDYKCPKCSYEWSGKPN